MATEGVRKRCAPGWWWLSARGMVGAMSAFKPTGDYLTALGAPWSEREYLRWQREQEERDDGARESANVRALTRFDPECEAAVRALEEGWGRGCQERSGGDR